MEKLKFKECTPLLKDVANQYISDLNKWNKEKNIEKNETDKQKEGEDIYSNEHALNSAKIDKTFTRISSNKEKDDKKLGQCNKGKQPSGCHLILVDDYQAIST